jgi:hypothetical protein
MTMCKFLTVAGTVIGFMSGVPALAYAEARASLNIADRDAIYVDGGSFKIISGTANGDPSAVMEKSGARELGPAAIIFRKGDKLYLATVPPGQGNAGSNRRNYGDSGYRDYGDNGYRDYGGNRYRDHGNDIDENPSTAQSEREWREWQDSLRKERNRRSTRGDRRDYGDNGYRDYGDNGYRDYSGNGYRDHGNDIDENPSTAQSEREWREWQDSLRQERNRRNPRGARRDYGDNGYRDYGDNGYRDYGSDRLAVASNGDRFYVNDPDYARYRLKHFFDENWTASEK